jgi:hypothetical protein
LGELAARQEESLRAQMQQVGTVQRETEARLREKTVLVDKLQAKAGRLEGEYREARETIKKLRLELSNKE